MSAAEFFLIVPGMPVLSALIWVVAAMLLLYLARHPAHQAIAALARVLHSGFRLAAQSVLLAQRRLAQRNKEVLLAAGREASERMIEREFERVDATVRRDLAEYPALQRQLSENITRIDEDYQESADVPPTPPAWVKAVEAVAKISARGEPMVAQVLEDIHGSLVRAQHDATQEYRDSSAKRHRILRKMMPLWRHVQQSLGKVDKSVNSLLDRTQALDRQMEEYEQIVRQTDRAERMLSSSSLTQFFIAGFVLAIAIGGALINFNLIARPMQEMVGGSSYLMGFKVANIAAMVIILVEVAMGLFLMESLRITRLFPIIGALDDKIRVRMIWATFGFLLCLASVEAGLAYMREILAQDDAALVASLVEGGSAAAGVNEYRWITTAAQMGMGFILPFALTFVAIPLESFIHSTRTVLGYSGVGLLRALAFVLRLLGNLARYGGLSLIRVYDLAIFLPLWVERLVHERKAPAAAGQKRPAASRPAAVEKRSDEQESGMLPPAMEG